MHTSRDVRLVLAVLALVGSIGVLAGCGDADICKEYPNLCFGTGGEGGAGGTPQQGGGGEGAGGAPQGGDGGQGGAGGEGGQGGDGGQGGEGGAAACTPATVVADCGADTDCASFDCVDGACDATNEQNGEPCNEGGGDLCIGGTCVVGSCGDGVVSGTEGCDDDNVVTGDGCGSACRRVVAVADGSAAADHSCALLDEGSVKCWGANGSGQLGLGDSNARGDAAGEMGDNLPAVSLGTGRTVKALATGSEHTCAILDNDNVKCWGSNSFGRLGLGDTLGRGGAPGQMGDNLPTVSLGTGRTAKAIAAGAGHTCALLDNDTVKCWGHNLYGQLGLGDSSDRGDAAGEMGDNLLAVSLGTGRTAKALATGLLHTCALLDNDSVKCWGYNGFGRLGLGNTQDRGDAAGEMGDSLPVVSLGTGRTGKALVATNTHSCVLLDNDTVKCWGGNSEGRLGLGDTQDRGDAAGEMGDSLLAVSLGTGRTAKALAAGNGHTCTVLDDDSVKCWGNNGSGQLGLGDTGNRGDAAGEMGDNLPAVSLGTGRTASAIRAGFAHVCALLDNDTVKCWGAGALGLGDASAHGDGPGEMGDLLSTLLLP